METRAGCLKAIWLEMAGPVSPMFSAEADSQIHIRFPIARCLRRQSLTTLARALPTARCKTLSPFDAAIPPALLPS